MSTPYIGFGNEELSQLPKVKKGDWIQCNKCALKHELEAADDGSELALFYKCADKAYLGAVNGRSVVGFKPTISGEI